MRSVLFVVLALTTGCGVAYQESVDRRVATTSLSSEVYCPVERVSADAHPELKLVPSERYMSDLRLEEDAPPWVEPALPPEIAADPARLKMWQVDRDAKYHDWQSLDAARRMAKDPERNVLARSLGAADLVSVSGCGVTRIYACTWVKHRHGDTRTCSWVSEMDFNGPPRVVCRDGAGTSCVHDAELTEGMTKR
jgi:hypothetical protein